MPGENRISELLNEKRYLKEIGEDFSHIDAEIFQITGRVLEADGGRIGYANAGVVSADAGRSMLSNIGNVAKNAAKYAGKNLLRGTSRLAGIPMLMYDVMDGGGLNEHEMVFDKIGYEYLGKMDDKMIEGEEGAMYSINDLLEFGYTPEEIQEFI
jgi:hypothetical protein|tara:strand:- start:305 stop:769 length:465 start_codon:yes stop_codon:yes gene_type:complete